MNAHSDDRKRSLLDATQIAGGHNISTKSTPVLLVFVTAYLTAVVLTASYSASFISYLTVRNVNLPFTDFNGFLRDGSYTLTVMRKSAELEFFKNASARVLREIYEKFLLPYEDRLPSGTLEGLQKVCNSRHAHVTSINHLMFYMNQVNCSLIVVPDASFPSSLAFATVKNSAYKGLLNYKLQSIRREGFINIWKNYVSSKMKSTTDTPAPSINITDIAPILCILAGGTGIALCIFGLECFIKYIFRIVNSKATKYW
ncbi:glutamate receptor ionotropic, delta-1-like [Periplaneta americana]|uniref:glutamate receptor ionotropic, delta-1-like n=1 Tax=Periplaneta americana TaxID=6978 RepID=UPI0037E7D8A9